MADFNSDIAISAPTSALKAIESKGMSTNVRVPLANLKPLPGFNVRVKGTDDYKEAVRAFADSIKLNGFYDHKPLAAIVLEGDPTVYVYDGETRYDALMLLETEGTTFDAIPVSLAPAGTTVEDLTVSMAQSNDGRALTPIALAELVKRLLSYNPDKNLAAARIGKTVRYVDNLLVLAGAPKSVRDAVASDKIAAAEAVKIVRKDKAGAAKVVADKVKAAEAKGQTKATPKRSATGPKMKRVSADFSVPEGQKMADVLKGIAKRVREEFGIDKDDLLEETGSITVTIHVIDHEAEAAAAAKAAKAKAEAAKPKPAAKPKAEPKPKATPKTKPTPAPAPAPAAAEAPAEKPKRSRAKTPSAATTPAVVQEAPETPPAPEGGEAAGDPAPEAQAAPQGDGTGDDGMGGL